MTIDARADATGEEDPAYSQRMRRITWGIGIVLFGLAFALPLLRQTGVHSWRTIWAEDAAVYYVEAYDDGGFNVVLRGYAGYLQLPSRILVLGAPYVPTTQLSVYLAFSSAFVHTLLAWFLYRATAGWIGSKVARLVIGSLVVLMPVLAIENTATITNTIWVFAAATPWALVSLAERKTDVATRGAVAFLGATSSALVVLFFPLAIGWAIYRRTRAAYAVTGIYLVGLATQAWTVTHTKDHARVPVVNSASDLVTMVAQRIFVVYLVGEKGVASLWVEHGTTLLILSTVLVAGALGVALVGAERRNQVLALTFVAYAFITFVFPVWGRGTSTIQLDATVYHDDAMRYSVVPVMLMASAFAVLLAPVGATASRAIARIGRPIFIGQLIFLMVVGFSVHNPRSDGPGWPEAMTTAYEQQCYAQPPEKEVPVIISPNIWMLDVPCEDLRP